MAQAVWLVLSLYSYAEIFTAVWYIAPPVHGDAARRAIKSRAVEA